MDEEVEPDRVPPHSSRKSLGVRSTIDTVPERMATVLRRAKAAEQTATGPGRLPALRLTRFLIAGARLAGCTDRALVDCLGVGISTVRDRGTSDGWVDVEDFIRLSGLDATTIATWADGGELRHTATGKAGRSAYPASELMLALRRFDHG